MQSTTQAPAKRKFAIGAVLLLIYVVISNYNIFLYDNFSFEQSWKSWLSILLLIGLAVVLLCKKDGYAMIVPVALLACWSFYSCFSDVYVLLSIFPWSPLFNMLSFACIILLSLPGIGVTKFKPYQKIIVYVLIALSVLSFVFEIDKLYDVNRIHTRDPRYIRFLINRHGLVISEILYSVSIILIGLWAANPYQKVVASKTSNASTASSNSEYFVSLGKHVLLLLFTFGIWNYIWVHKMTAYHNTVKDSEYRNPTSKLLLYMFIPFYSIYWTYKMAQTIDRAAAQKGVQSDLGTLCLILSIFVPILPPILMQDKVNQVLTANAGAAVAASTAVTNEFEALEKYNELLEKGIITQEEYDAKKKQILGL